MKNFDILGVHWEIRLLKGAGGGSSRNTDIEVGGLPKKVELGQFVSLRRGGGLSKKEGGGRGCFWGGGRVDNAVYTMLEKFEILSFLNYWKWNSDDKDSLTKLMF